MKDIHKTLIFTLILCFIAIVSSLFIQIKGKNVIEKVVCSYLDPVTIDMMAFLVALFLIVEGFARIYENPKNKFHTQFTRSLRISIGFAILTIHVMQFIHK